MQSLDVVSVNLVSILISLCNLIILYCILKKFLFKPVTNILNKRKAEVDSVYARAEEAEKDALQNKEHYEAVMAGANQEAEHMLREAKENARRRSERVLSDAQNRSNAMMKAAEQEIALEKEKMRDDIRQEMTDMTLLLTQKVLGREVNDEDQRTLIDEDLALLEGSHDAFGQ